MLCPTVDHADMLIPLLTRRWWSRGGVMRSYKSYILLILVPYLCLIFLFHTQLQTYDGAKSSSKQAEAQNFHIRDLRLKNVSHDRHMRRTFRAHRNVSRHVVSAAHEEHISVDINDARVANLPQEDKVPWQQMKDVPISFKNGSKLTDILPTHKKIIDFRNAQFEYCSEPIDSSSFLFQPIVNSYVYSAFYDDRSPDVRYIRVVALLKKAEKPAIFCHIPKDPQGQSTTYISTMATYYEMCENHGKDFGGWLLSCDLPDDLKDPPCHVFLSLDSDYSEKTNNIRIPVVLMQNPMARRVDFGVCVPPLFGYIPSTTLIEFVELTKILGAQHVIFYAHQVPREIQKVLRYYEQIGVATVIPWDLPVQDKEIWYHGQLLAINDCLYRNMHRFRYLAFNDIDEFIVPHLYSNWSAMIEHIYHETDVDVKRHAGYSFQSAFFDPLIESTSRVLYDLESDLRTKAFSKVRTKVMVDAARIHELGIHHISKPVKETSRTIYIEPGLAFLHHYRKCVTDFDHRMNCQVFARDESISRYIPTLRHNVHQTLWILKETENLSYRDKYMNRLR